MSPVLTTRDPRTKTGAYVREGKSVYEVLGQEKNSAGDITGFYDLENIVGQHCSGRTFVHSRIRRTAVELANLVLVVPAPDATSVPDYLDADMEKHIAATEIRLAADGHQNFGLQGPPS